MQSCFLLLLRVNGVRGEQKAGLMQCSTGKDERFGSRMKDEIARKDVDGSNRIETFKHSQSADSECDHRRFVGSVYCLTSCQAAAQTSRGQ